MHLQQIVDDYEARLISADEALELADCVSLLALYQLLEQEISVAGLSPVATDPFPVNSIV